MSFRSLLIPSFRSRLRLFFVVGVVVPMLTMAVVLFVLVIKTEESNTDARLSTALIAAMQVITEEQERAEDVSTRIAKDQVLADARARRDRPAVQARLDRLVAQESARFVDLKLEGFGDFQSGELPGLAPVERKLTDAQGERRGTLTVSTLSPEDYGQRVES